MPSAKEQGVRPTLPIPAVSRLRLSSGAASSRGDGKNADTKHRTNIFADIHRAELPANPSRASVTPSWQTGLNSVASLKGGEMRARGSVGDDIAPRIRRLSSADQHRPLNQKREMHFCPDLVVPGSCECVLVVPLLPKDHPSFPVADDSGHVVLHVSRSVGSGGPGNLVAWKASLLSSGGKTLARCSATALGEFHFFQASGAYFGKLRKAHSKDHFTLLTIAGARLHFWGSFELHAVNVTDDTGKLLATTELHAAEPPAPDQCYHLRIAPLTDVGLIVCSLLCINSTVGSSQD